MPDTRPDMDAPCCSALALAEAELAAETRRIRRWATTKVREREAAHERRIKRLRRQVAEARLLAERAAHTSPTEDPVSFVLQHFGEQIVAMEAAGMPLDLRRLARWTPWREWVAWEADPMNSRLLAAYAAQGASFREAARSAATVWPVSEKVRFPDGVPLTFLDSFALVMAIHRADLRPLVAQRYNPTRKTYAWRWPIAEWPWPIKLAVKHLVTELNAANARTPFFTVADAVNGAIGSRALARIFPVDVIDSALATPVTPPVSAPASRPPGPSAKDKQRAKAEQILGGRCVDCGRTRADGVDLNLDELDGRGGGRRRRAERQPYGLRNEVIRYAEAHGGQPPPRIALRCRACHGRRHRLAYLAAVATRRQAQ
jgi:hypothetical protein